MLGPRTILFGFKSKHLFGQFLRISQATIVGEKLQHIPEKMGPSIDQLFKFRIIYPAVEPSLEWFNGLFPTAFRGYERKGL
jgi:hypothetical protein